MNPGPPDYQCEGHYAAYRTDPANLSSPYPFASLSECQAVAWPPYSSTTSFAPFPHSLPVASSSRDHASGSELAAALGGYEYPHHAAHFAIDGVTSTICCQPHQTPYIVEAPLATIAPLQLTLATPPTCTAASPNPAISQQNETPTCRPTKRRHEETKENAQAPKASTAKKRRAAVSTKLRSHNALPDVAESQSSQHAAPSRVGHTARKRQPKGRGARPPSPGLEYIPIVDDSQDVDGRVQVGRMGTHSRSAIALADPSVANRADLPKSNTPVSADVAAPVPTEEWCTPAFYEELRKTASILVAQNRAPTSSASDGVVQHGPRIDEGPQADAPSPGVPHSRASTKRTRADSRRPRAKRRSRLSAEKAQKLLCPLADSSGVCHSKAEPYYGSSKPPKASTSKKRATQEPQPPKLSMFGRPADLERHILSVHLNVHVRCRRCHEANKCAQFARYDGFMRHLRTTCFGVKDFAISGRAAGQFGFISMPCYQDSDFARALSALRKTRTALSFETLLHEKYRHTNLEIQRCNCCENLDDEEMEAIKPPPSVVGGSDAQPETYRVFEVPDEDDRLPPEAEEGVDEESVSEPDSHDSNIHVGSASFAGHLPEMLSTAQEYPAPSLPGLCGREERESEENSAHHGAGVVPLAADHSTVQATSSDSTSNEPTVLNLDELLAQPWHIDFGLEALASDPVWSITSWS